MRPAPLELGRRRRGRAVSTPPAQARRRPCSRCRTAGWRRWRGWGRAVHVAPLSAARRRPQLRRAGKWCYLGAMTDNPLLAPWTTPSASRRSRKSSWSISAPPSMRPSRDGGPSARRSRPTPPAELRKHRSSAWSAPARPSTGSSACSTTSSAWPRATRSRRSSAKSSRNSRANTPTRALDDALFARVDAVHAASRAGSMPEARRLVERRWLAFKRAGAGLPAQKKQRLAEIAERLASLGAAFGQNVLGDEKAYALSWRARPTSRACRLRQQRRRPRRRQERGHPGKWVDHAVALLRRAVPAILRAPRLARAGLARLRRARDGRARQRPGDERDRRAARGNGGAARLRDLRRLQARRHDGGDARAPRSICCDRVWTPGPRRRARGRQGVAGDDRGRRRQFRASALGLALLRREAPAGAL